jgi:hypothetical protein
MALPVLGDTPRTLDGFLRDGRIEEGLAAFASPKNNSDRFSLGILQALGGLQEFISGSAKLGVNQDFVRSSIPFFRVMQPVSNMLQSSNQVATPEKVAALFNGLRGALKKANATLAAIDDKEFKVEVNLSKARMDFDGDGVVLPDELLLAKLGPVLGLNASSPDNQDVIIRFDNADAAWLKGYTHFLIGVMDIVRAYDWRPMWDQCAHLIFQHPQPMPPIAQFTSAQPGQGISTWVDLIAAIHDMRLELEDKQAVADARDEFRAMIGCSRLCWKRVLAETDNDHEWLPSPKQTGPGGAKVTQEQIDAWLHVLDELDAILTGKKLLPHWRMKSGTGINVPKLVASPPRLDLVLMIQGTTFIPYLEEGEVSDQIVWRRLVQPFGPGFWRFAIWSQ